MSIKHHDMYKELLLKDLLPASGCTEPIALALAGAKTREVLGAVPEYIDVYCSGNVIKNVKAVTIPNSDGRRGPETAVALGAVGGCAQKDLRVLEDVAPQDMQKADELMRQGRVRIFLEEGAQNIYVRIEAKADGHTALVEIVNSHNAFRRIERDGEVLYEGRKADVEHEFGSFAGEMTPDDIMEYAENVDIMGDDGAELRERLKMQIDCNTAIGREGIQKGSGAAIGRILTNRNQSGDPFAEGVALAAGGSDARMSGCKMPVVINSGSGNQGITIACPIAAYWKSTGKGEEALYRALLLANLMAIYEKYYIGKLSAYCGAVSAAAAAGAGVAYLMDMTREGIMSVVSNTLAIASGILCDGAKASCAGKIAAALGCVQISIDMVNADRSFLRGEGIVSGELERTVHNVGTIAQDGMTVTDREILKVMLTEPVTGTPKDC